MTESTAAGITENLKFWQHIDEFWDILSISIQSGTIFTNA
jgi:hypothetical protein